MAGPGGREVGRVSIRTLPDTSKFASSLQTYLERTERRLRLELPVSLSARDVARTEAELALLTRDREIDLNINKSVLSGLGTSLGGLSGGMGGLGRIQLILAAVVVALPAIATAILALPSMLAAIVAPIAAVALGLEGIKDAAQVLAEPFRAMQSVVSAVFEKGLTPVFENLVAIFPALTAGFSSIANALVLIADTVVKQLVSSGGLEQIAASFASISAALVTLAPAMGPLTDSLLLLLVEGTAAFARFAPYLADIIVKFNQLVTLLSESGALSVAFDSLSIVIGSVIGVFGALVLAGAYVFTSLGMLARFISSVFVGAWNLARGAFQRGRDAVVAIAKGIPGAIVGAITGVGRVLYEAGLGLMGRLAAGLWEGIKKLTAPLASAASKIAGFFPGSPIKEGPLKDHGWNQNRPGKLLVDSLVGGIDGARGDLDKSLTSLASVSAVGAAGFTIDAATNLPSGNGSRNPIELGAGTVAAIGEVILAGASRVANGLDDQRDYKNTVKSRTPGAFAGSLS